MAVEVGSVELTFPKRNNGQARRGLIVKSSLAISNLLIADFINTIDPVRTLTPTREQSAML
jgi:hypothetical protein